MRLLTIVGVIVAILAIAGGLYAAVRAINERAVTKYGYQPISLARTIIMVIPYVLFIVAMILHGGDNMMAAAGLAVLVSLGVAWHITKHSSFPIAVGSVLLLSTFGLLISAFMFWFLFLRTNGQRGVH